MKAIAWIVLGGFLLGFPIDLPAQESLPTTGSVPLEGEEKGLRPKKLIGKLIPGGKKRQERKASEAAAGNNDGAVVIPNPGNTTPSSMAPPVSNPLPAPAQPVVVAPVAPLPEEGSKKGLLGRVGKILPGKEEKTSDLSTAESMAEEERKGLLSRLRIRRNNEPEDLTPNPETPPLVGSPVVPSASSEDRPPEPVAMARPPAELQSERSETLTIPLGPTPEPPAAETPVVAAVESPEPVLEAEPDQEAAMAAEPSVVPEPDVPPASIESAIGAPSAPSAESVESPKEEMPTLESLVGTPDTPPAVAEEESIEEPGPVVADASGESPEGAATATEAAMGSPAASADVAETLPMPEPPPAPEAPDPAVPEGWRPIPPLEKVDPQVGASRLVFSDASERGDSEVSGTARFVAIREGVSGVMTSLRGSRQSAGAGAVFQFLEREEDVIRVRSQEGVEGRIETWQLRDATFDEAVEFLKSRG